MNRNPDLVGGFNRLDSTCLKAGEGKILAKEGADGLLGLSVIHKDWQRTRHCHQNRPWVE